MAAAYICRRYILNDQQLADTFDLLDLNKDGRLNRSEIAALLRIIKVEATRTELDFIFGEMDPDNSGTIKKSDFVSYMKTPLINRITLGELEEHFKKYDSDHDGCITLPELKSMLAQTADIHDEDAVEQLFELWNNKGKISFSEFVKMIRE
uniref:EF-hand domain-containing protein n=1 Tax=Acrobeloides nanus TaxID=290746 RepID=A0A914DNX9_9BILA